ncbi:MAG: PD40 domain-containing protein [Deinococcus sp.]|nr:PD40 domain-containing protein [Deinococcus sp.]
MRRSPLWRLLLLVTPGLAQVVEGLVTQLDLFPDNAAATDEGWAAWSPDGETLLFGSNRGGNANLWLKTGDQAARQITDHPAFDGHGTWSPDGRRIAFLSERSGSIGIWILDLESGAVIPLVVDQPGLTLTICAPSWSPQGRIAFEAVRNSDADAVTFTGADKTLRHPNVDIFTVAENGSDLERLTDSPGSDGYPAYSPDGSLIAFDSNRTGEFGIWVMNADGSEQHQITSGGDDGFSAWHPSGGWLAFQSNRAGNPDIWMVNLDGSGLRQLTSDSANDINATFTHDGRFLTFISRRNGGDQDIFLLDLSTVPTLQVIETVQPPKKGTRCLERQ